MNIVFFSDCLTTLEADLHTTSSQKYEYQLAWHLMLYEDIKVFVFSSRLEYGKNYKEKDLELIGIKSSTKRKTYKNFLNLIRGNSRKFNTVIFYGYDLIKTVSLIFIKRSCNLKVLSIIFDTHLGAIENFNYFKKIVSKIYFYASIKLLPLLDGYILFQAEAASELNLRKPTLITRPGIDKDAISDYVYSNSNNQKSNFTITYLGSLMVYNGIIELLKIFDLYDDKSLRLRIFGAGLLSEKVIEYSAKDNRIFYGGLINQKEVREEIKRADLLINLRDPGHIVCKFAYPSKLIEYMGTGVPVLTLDPQLSEDIGDCVYLINQLEAKEIYDKINTIREDSLEKKVIRVNKAKKYIANNNDWRKICKELEGFFYEFHSG